MYHITIKSFKDKKSPPSIHQPSKTKISGVQSEILIKYKNQMTFSREGSHFLCSGKNIIIAFSPLGPAAIRKCARVFQTIITSTRIFHRKNPSHFPPENKK